jgi:hypothetical protein
MKLSDLLKRIPGITTDLAKALDGKASWYLWSGKIGKNTGKYWIPNLFDASKLPEAVAKLAKAEGISEFSAAGLIEKSHKGIGNAEIGLCPWAFAEMDAVKRDEQDRRLDALATATGLSWAMRVFSGGKSVHAYLAFSDPLPPADPLRLEIQRLLIVVLEGDTRITDMARLMRLPGYAGADRPQPVLGISDATYEATDIRDRLLVYAASLGINDVPTAYRALQVAEDLEHEAARGHADAPAMLTTARALRDGRASVTLGGIAQAVKGWKKTGGSGAAGAGGNIGGGGAARVVEAAEWAALVAGLTVGERCYPPCCSGRIKGTTGIFYGDSIRCHKCQVTYRPAKVDGGDLPAEVLDITEVEQAPVILRPRTPDAIGSIDDIMLSPDGITGRVKKLVERRRYTDALDLAELVSAPSDDLFDLVERALAGLREVAERAACALAEQRARDEGRSLHLARIAREAEITAREAEKKKAKAEALKQGLKGYEGRLEKKKSAADAIPEKLRAGAEATLRFAASLVGQVRARRAELGLPVERPADSQPCGVPLALHNAGDGTALGARICRDEDCPVHGPGVQARRIAAVARMPLFNAKGLAPIPLVQDSTAEERWLQHLVNEGCIDLPLGDRNLWEYSFDVANLKSFENSWGRTEFEGNSASTSIIESKAEFPSNSPLHGYVTFNRGDGKIVALTTHPLAIGGSGKRGGRPSKLAGSLVREIPAEDAEACIIALGLASLRVTPGEDLDGLTLDPTVITGTITSSQTLHLDPEGTVRTALAAPWLCIGEIGLKELRDGLKAAGMAVTTREDEHSPDELGKVTSKDVTPETLFGIVSANGTPSFGAKRPVVFHEDEYASNVFDAEGLIAEAAA